MKSSFNVVFSNKQHVQQYTLVRYMQVGHWQSSPVYSMYTSPIDALDSIVWSHPQDDMRPCPLGQ